MDFTKRTELLLQKEGIDKLSNKKVAVCGLGGVGGYVAEILARSGVGHLVLIDNDYGGYNQYQSANYCLAFNNRENKMRIVQGQVSGLSTPR